MGKELDLYAALQSRDINQVDWALSNATDPRARHGSQTLIEHAAAIGFSAAVQLMHTRALMHTRTLSLAHQTQPSNPYAEISPSNLIIAAMCGQPGALLALAHTDAPFLPDQVTPVLYSVFDPEHPERWREALPVLNEYFIGRLQKSPLPHCARSLIAARIPVYPREAWTSMVDMGWVDPKGMLKLSRHRPSMKLWASTLVMSEDSRQIAPGHLLERLEWLYQSGFTPKVLIESLLQGPLRPPPFGQGQGQSVLIPTLHALEHRVKLDSGTHVVSAVDAPAPTAPRF